VTDPGHGRLRRWHRLQPFWKLIAVVAGWALLTVATLAIGLEAVAGVLTLVHLGGLVGAPLAIVLDRQLRSLAVVAALSIGLSMAMTTLIAQLLLWFGVSQLPVLIATATAYGLVVAILVADWTGPARRVSG
jgi:uncharacterized membrane protein